MRRPSSLALRVTLLFAVAAALVFSAVGWVIIRSIEHHFEMEDFRELEVIAQAVEEALPEAEGAGFASLKRRFEDILVGHHGASLYVATDGGAVVYYNASTDLTVPLRTPHGAGPFVWADSEHIYRTLIRKARVGELSYDMVVAVPIDYHLHFLEDFRVTLWWVVGGGIVIMGVMGWVAVRRGHVPLRDIVATLRRISAHRLDSRLDPDSLPAELTDLAVSFNDMLGRMEEAFQRLSNFSADIAHELRTPVAALMTQTQVALSQTRDVDAYREILYSNMEEYERMAQMIGDMLFLAKADNGLYAPETTVVDLAQEARTLLDYYEAWAEERGVGLALEGTTSTRGDKLMLRRALGNLLSNAVRHTPAGQSVRVRLADEGGLAAVTVENPGNTIPPEHLPQLFERFYRVDAARSRSGEGVGLGLSIVKSIVDLHRGSIDVVSADGITRFRILLPKGEVSIERSS